RFASKIPLNPIGCGFEVHSNDANEFLDFLISPSPYANCLFAKIVHFCNKTRDVTLFFHRKCYKTMISCLLSHFGEMLQKVDSLQRQSVMDCV
ncbi:hypothetical protein, partial [Hallella sp.]|uniref:hypothetical protein n=1 Tax=Hallella sp. TaxID=2980186 RepID=UPI0030799C07